MKKILMTTATLAAFCAGPLSVPSASHFDQWSLFAKAEANNGNGGGAGKSNGNRNGNGGGNSINAESSDRGNSNSNGKARGIDKNDTSNNGDAGTANDEGAPQEITREKSLHAVLGRINSIGRNLNGIMNSKDPHLAGIRNYIVNSAELAKAETAADAAHATYDAALADYTDAGLTGDPATTLSQLTSAVASADATTAAALYEQIDLTNALLAASNELVASEARVAQYTILASDASLVDALAAMSNHKLSGGDISAETLEWSKAVLGVGDATGAIDAYMAQ